VVLTQEIKGTIWVKQPNY